MTMGLAVVGWAPALEAEVRKTPHTVAAQVMFNIARQPLAAAVTAFTQQSDMPVAFARDSLEGLTSPGLQGQHEPAAGLRALLAGLPVRSVNREDDTLELVHQADEQSAIQLGDVDVRGLRDKDQVFAVPRSVSTVDREQIDRRAVRTAADLLEETEGIYSAMSQRDPGLSVNIRGVQDYGRVNMNIDGARQNYSQMGHQQRNGTMYIDPELLAAIDIFKGSSSGQGGASALGGLASFRTLSVDDVLQPGQEMGGRLRASHGIGRLGNGMHFAGSTALGVRTEVWDGVVAYSERHLGEYRSGQSRTDVVTKATGYKESFPLAWDRWLKNEAEYTDSIQRSYLAKFGINLPNDQRLQVSQMNTRIGYNDAVWRALDSEKQGKTIYRLNGRNQIESTTSSVDYSLNPDSDMIDVKAKVYYTSTSNFQDNERIKETPSSKNHFRTNTLGLQLENTARFSLGSGNELSFNYGGELVRDQFKPKNFGDLDGEPTKPYVDGLDAQGERLLGSLFNSLTWNYQDWLTATAGLRYDHYKMRGTTGYSIWGAVEGEYGRGPLTKIYDVDRSEGGFSPTFDVTIKPGPEWLQLYGHYGRAWRGPSVNEVFSSGRPHAGGGQRVYPNPTLKPEHSRDWEVGLNVIKDSFLLVGDRLTAKVAYFDTKIDNFSFMNLGVDVPGSPVPLLGTKFAHVNNMETTRFRGLDYKLSYDTGRHYADLTYTQMIGTNKFCSPMAYMGGAIDRDLSDFVVINGTDSRGNPTRKKQYKNIANPERNKEVSCGGIMGNASYMPADRGAFTLGTRAFDRKLDVGLRVRYSPGHTEKRNYDTLDQATWPRYQIYDIYASYSLSKNMNLGLLLDNATDVAYIPAMGDLNNITLARGRTLTGSMEYRF